MPRTRNENIVSETPEYQTVEVEVTERDAKKLTRYTRPTEAYFGAFLKSLSNDPKDGPAFMEATFGPKDDGKYPEESPLDIVRRLYVSSLDAKARRDVYVQLASESTVITVGKERIDVMTFPLKRLVKAINGYRAQREVRAAALAGNATEDSAEYATALEAAEKSIGFGPWRTATRKLVEGGKARENEATGLLEMVEAA